MEEGLLTGRGKKQSKETKRRFDECEAKVRSLRSKNNQLQKQCENELDSDIRQAVKEQGYYLEREIGQIKALVGRLAADFTDPPSKLRTKELLNHLGKQIQRNKRIMEEFITRASTSPSFLKAASNPRISKTEMERKRSSQIQSIGGGQEGVSLVESEEIHGEVLLEQRINAEKQALLREIEEKNNKINQLYNQMGEMVGQQGDMVLQLHSNNATAHQNLIHANDELDQAIVEQKKSKRKYFFLGACIVVVVLIAAGIVYLFFK